MGLVHERLRRLPAGHDWPPDICEAIAAGARAERARELLRQREISGVLEALAQAGVHPILFKGTALAYTVYGSAHLRPRSDTDLLVGRDAVERIRDVLAGRGYRAPLYCDGELLFCQFELARDDEFGVSHAFDFHWKISTQTLFADVLTYDELAATATSVPALGPHARAAGLAHALLLACVHPVMHHRNEERPLWIHDIHVLASRLTPSELERVADLALARRVGRIVANGLTLARRWFLTPVSETLIARLEAASPREPSAVYLEPHRRWHDELASNLKGLDRHADRWRLLREVLFPPASYMLKAYGFPPGSFRTLLLPALYLHRGMSGGLRVLGGRK